MKPCEKELQVAAQAIRGDLPESLFWHVEVCPACSEAVAAVEAFRNLVGEPFAAPLPSPEAVWWKAALQKQQATRRRARLPLICMQWIGRAIALLAAGAIGVRAAPLALSLPMLLWIGLGLIGITCFSFACVVYAWSRLDS